MTHKKTINHDRRAVKSSGGRTKHYKINEMTGINIHLYSYLNENGPHRLTESGTNRYGLAIVGVALLEEVNHYGAGFEVSNAQVQSSMPLSLNAACGSKCRTPSHLLLQHHVCLLVAILSVMMTVD